MIFIKDMNSLTQFLVDGILLEGIEKTIVVYSGRFQPFHKGHFATYENLIKKFGKDNVYIATSNKTDNQKSPFNFREKKMIMQKMFGIPSNKIVEVRNPYAPMEVLANYPEETTGFISVVGEKDEMRLSGKYFTPYKGKVEMGYRDKGYVYISPSQSTPISGTDVRNWLKAGDEQSKKDFLRAYPKFDESIFKLITLKLSKLSEEVISEVAGTRGVQSDGEPDSGYSPDGTLRIIDRGKPEPWLKQLGMKQIDKPRADAMRGKGKSKDTESQFRKLYYKVQNIKGTDLDPALQPHKVEDWEEVGDGKKVKKIKRFWEGKVEYTDDDADNNIRHPREVPHPSGLGYDDLSVPSPYTSQPKSPVTPYASALGGITKPTDKDSNIGIAQKDLEKKWASIHATIKGPVKPFREDVIPGGVSANKTIADFVKKYDNKEYYHPSQMADYIKEKIKKGAKVEMEHTTDKKVAVEIAKDHIWEDLNYYEKLAKMEKEGITESFSSADLTSQADSANSTTGKEHNISWDDYDDQDYYVINLPGWDVINKTSSQLMGNEVVNRTLPLHNHKGDENGEPHYIKLRRAVKPLNTEGVINEASKEGIVNYYKAVCKKLKLTPLPVKFGSVGKAGASTTFDTKTFKPEYVSFDLSKLQDVERAILHEIAHHILLLKQGNPYHNCNKSAAFKKVENNLIDKFFYSAESRLLREEIIIEIAAGLYAGKVKIGGHPVDIEVELIGADNKTKEFITKIIHIDNQYKSKLPIGSTFKIPARIFRTPGGGWYKIKHKAFEMAKADMDAVEKYADSQMSPEDVELGKETDHFFQRLNDPRNGKEISPAELTGFFKRLARNKKKFLEFLNQYKEFVVKDRPSDINIAFIKVANRLIAKTIMRKADFKSATPIFTTESLLMEGGAYGHMNHPFDVQMNLTFGDLKNIVKQALNGKLELAREKTDGQALAISWVNGRLVAARNKSHLKSKGKDAMGVQDVISKFAGRGSVSDAFTFAIKDLESAVRGLSDTDKKSIFKDGKCFMNCEIIYPENTNVIPYGTSLLVFHGTMEYNEAGDAVGENPAAGAKLAAMVKKINADVQSKFTIQGPPIQKLPVNKDLKAKQSIYLSKIQSLQSEFGLTDKNGVADYHQAWWRQFIDKNAPTLDEQQKIGLVKRWAFGDKTFRLNTIQDSKLRAWAEQTDKKDQAKITKDNLLKFEEIFLGVGADVLSFMESVLTANPDAAKQQMVGRLETAISSIRATGDAKNLAKLEIELARLNALGGFDKIVPNEGIVFTYKGATYKLTGAFAPLNQILGIFTFSR